MNNIHRARRTIYHRVEADVAHTRKTNRHPNKKKTVTIKPTDAADDLKQKTTNRNPTAPTAYSPKQKHYITTR